MDSRQPKENSGVGTGNVENNATWECHSYEDLEAGVIPVLRNEVQSD